MLNTAVIARRLALGLIVVAWIPDPARAQTPSTVQTGWVSHEIGRSTAPDEFRFDNGRSTIEAGGGTMQGQDDQFRFVYQIVSGDAKITARLDSLAPATLWSNAGLMIRSSLQPDAAHGALMVRGDAGLALQTRTQTSGLTTTQSGPLESGSPQWIGLERAGSRVTAYTSPDGGTWTAVGSASIALGADVYVGIAVTSQSAEERAVAQFSQVSLGGLPAGMEHRQIGGPDTAGTAWHSEGVYSLAAGATAKDSPDRVQFAYRRMQGDFDLAARVASSSAGASAGLMIRESLGADSRHAAVLVSSDTGYVFDRRIEIGAAIERTDAGPGGTPASTPARTDRAPGAPASTPARTDRAPGAPAWVKLVRRGTQVEVFRSDDGQAWTSIGSAKLETAGEVYVGLAVGSEGAGGSTTPARTDRAPGAPASTPARTDRAPGTPAEATAVLDHVSLTAPDPGAGLLPNLPPVVSLTSPGSGATFTAPATVTMSALAVDPELRLTEVEFFANGTLVGADSSSPYAFTWSSVAAGSYTLTAVASDADGGRATSSAVSITVQPGANEPPSVALTSPASGATFTAPATVALTASASDPENRLTRVEFYRDGTLLGTDTSSPYAFTWSSVAAGSYTLTARAFDADGAQTTSSAITITVNANQAPTVALTSPANGATFTAPATVALTASASDPENRLTRVEFYRDGTLLGTDTSSPYTFTWSSVAAGSYTLTARAFDGDGAQTTSSAVTITVNMPPPPAPRLVEMTASTDHDEHVTSYLLEVFASGADPEHRHAGRVLGPRQAHAGCEP